MSLAYSRRKAAIAAEKRRLGVNSISLTRFRFMQSGWARQITGPPIGTLADLLPMIAGDDDINDRQERLLP